MRTLIVFALVAFGAQLVDGALGMAPTSSAANGTTSGTSDSACWSTQRSA